MAIASGALERSRGNLRLAVKELDGRSRIAELYQSGCLKARMPTTPGATLEAICINTSGGLTDGDRVDTRVHAGPATRTVVTSQAAERVYRARCGAAAVSNSLEIAPQAVLAWLPQETIVFDGGRLRRSLNIEADSSSTLLAVEATVFGRTAMGEYVTHGLAEDEWSIRIGGKLALLDRTRFGESDLGAEIERPAVLGGGIAMATLVYAAPDCDDLVDALRSHVDTGPVNGGVSSLGRLLVTRLVSRDAAALRRVLMAMLETVASAQPAIYLPKVWTL